MVCPWPVAEARMNLKTSNESGFSGVAAVNPNVFPAGNLTFLKLDLHATRERETLRTLLVEKQVLSSTVTSSPELVCLSFTTLGRPRLR